LQFEEDDDDEVYHDDENDFSEDDQVADTPTTPFSPARKKFPSELKTLKCRYEGCTKTFNRPSRLESHIRSHTNERPHKCTYEDCDKAYLQEKHLQQHVKGSHTHERNFQCDWEGCSKTFLTSTRLKRHQSTHEGKERYRCTAYPPCAQTFRKHQTLQRHIRSEHLHLAPFPCTFVDPITNIPCTGGFDGAGGLRKHEERVHGGAKFFCTECTIPNAFDANGAPLHPGFTTNAQLQTHIRKEHANCLFCDLKCSSQRELQKHIETQHSGTTLEERKNVPCTFAGCAKKFTKKSNMEQHVNSVHMGQRFICGSFDVSSTPDLEGFTLDSGCDQEFVSKANVEDHIRTSHLGLPSLINANRVKSTTVSVVEDDDFGSQAKKGRKKGKKASAIDQLLGIDRNIPCIFPDCAHRFVRDNDLQNHLRSAHQPAPPTVDDALNFQNFQDRPAFSFPDMNMLMGGESLGGQATPQDDGRAELDALYDQADINWEFQRRGLEGGPFWVGADDGAFTPQPQDQWLQEEMEMRQLIGDDFVDPTLEGS
jgi:general transcription factor IIIA